VKRKWKIILGAVIALIIAGAFFTESTKGLEVDVLTVSPDTISKVFEEEGEVVSQVQRPIFPTYGGKIISLNVEEGQQVHSADVLAALDSQELELQLEQLKAEKKLTYLGKLAATQAKRQLDTARTDYQRSQQLFASGALTKAELEAAQSAFEAAETNLAQQQQNYSGKAESIAAQIDLLEHKIEQMNIKAPVDGIIANLAVKEGEAVVPNAPMMIIFQKENYQIETYILTEDVNRISPGMQVDLVQDNQEDDVRFSGTVKTIAPAAVDKISALGLEEKRVKVTIAPKIPDTLSLRPGYSLDVIFTTAKQEGKLIVPKTTLFPYQDGKALWLIKDGKASIHQVKTGFENDRNIVIEDGLAPGDNVILNPQLKGLKEGQKISGKNI